MSAGKVCKGPSRVPGQICGREVVAYDLCSGHYKQDRDVRPLTPLRGPHGAYLDDDVETDRISLRLPTNAAEAVRGVGQRLKAAEREEMGRGAAAVLEAWARGELVVRWKRKTPHLVRE